MEIQKKSAYIDELSMEISRKGKYIDTLEHERVEWHSMDSERIAFIRSLEHKIRGLKNMLIRNST